MVAVGGTDEVVEVGRGKGVDDCCGVWIGGDVGTAVCVGGIRVGSTGVVGTIVGVDGSELAAVGTIVEITMDVGVISCCGAIFRVGVGKALSTRPQAAVDRTIISVTIPMALGLETIRRRILTSGSVGIIIEDGFYTSQIIVPINAFIFP